MYSFFFAYKAPIISLLWSSIQQTRIPRERNGNSAAITYIDSKGIIRYKKIYNPGLPDLNEVMKELKEMA